MLMNTLRYSSNGAQINRPEDGEIAQSILENLEPWPTAWEDQRPSQYLHDNSYRELLPHYVKQVEEYAVSSNKTQESGSANVSFRNQLSRSGNPHDLLFTHLFTELVA
jgi:predicted metal-dependent peptidase